ncbi:MAG TPA: glycosyltransferase family 39 protein [Opitutaceae bacterium]|nr:glycosyltransferase family 39 protein [Opitutaceae bacterium]
MLRKVILFSLIAALAIVLGFVSFHWAPGEAVALVKRYGYWQILLVTTLFAHCLVRSLRADVAVAARGWRVWVGPAALVLGAAAFLHVHERHEFKIVMDEVVLQDTAMRMHFEREAAAMVRGYDLAGNFTALNVYVDKRPLFFPFLLSLVHDLTGYRVGNAFGLNAGLSVIFVGLAFLVGRRLGGMPAAVTAVLLVASVPLIHQNVASSGFELLNLVMILATLWLGMRYVERPDTDRLGAFVLAGILLAQTRYESVLFILPVGIVILYVWWRARAIDLAWPIMVAPLLLVIVPLHFNVFKLAAASWQLNDVPGADTPFSPRFFYDNVGHAMNFFLCTDGTQPNSMLVSLLGVVGVGFFVLTFYREHRAIFRSRPAEAVFCIFLLALLVHTVLMLCYFWGTFDDPIIRRLSLPSHLLLIFAFLFVFPRLVSHPARWRGLILVSAFFVLGFTVPSVAMHRYTQENFAARTNAWLSDFLDGLGDDSALAIDGGSGLQWFVHRKSSIAVDALASHPEKYAFHFRNRSFRHFFVVQRMGSDFEHGTSFASIDDDVGDGLQLEPVAEQTFSPVYRIRISRVVAVDEDKLKAWAARRGKAVPLTAEMKSAVKKSDSDAIDRWFKLLP